MKLRSESIENADFTGPKGEFENLFLGRNRIEIHAGLKINFRTKKSVLSRFAVAGFLKYRAIRGHESVAVLRYKSLLGVKPLALLGVKPLGIHSPTQDQKTPLMRGIL